MSLCGYAVQGEIENFEGYLVAACLALVIGAVSGFSIYAEAREYESAITFFHEYNLSTDGLARGDIKNIYRDITAQKFSYDKTAELLTKSVGGYEIVQKNPSPEDLENLWNYRNSIKNYPNQNSSTNSGANYQYKEIEKYDDKLGFDVLDKIIFTKSINGKVQWSVDISNIVVENYIETGNSVIVYGSTPTWSSAMRTYGRIAMINQDGVILWNKTTSNGFKDEYIGAVVSNYSAIAVFSRGDLKYLCFTLIDMSGNATAFTKKEVGNYGIAAAAKLGEGYIVRLLNYTTNDLLIKVNADGSFSDTFTYSSDDVEYFITDMIEFNGKIYLSTNLVPKLKDSESSAGGRYEIAAVLNKIFDNKTFDISSEALTKLLRDHFTAVLLVCNTESGTPQTFYTVKGSFGSKLSIDNSSLIWDVESITESYFSPYTSSFSIGGSSYVYKHSFDKTGKIASQEKTDQVISFRK